MNWIKSGGYALLGIGIVGSAEGVIKESWMIAGIGLIVLLLGAGMLGRE